MKILLRQNQQPSCEAEMNPLPKYGSPAYKASYRLEGKTTLITGGVSGIGPAVVLASVK